MPRSLLFLLLYATPALAADAVKLPPPAKRPVSFEKDVQPLLARACLSCHGAEKQRGGLRLDDGQRAGRGGNSGAVIKRGDSAASLLIHLVAGAEPDRRMPPGKGKELKAEEIALLRAWIDQGAVYPAGAAGTKTRSGSKHWAFQPVRGVPTPKIANVAWPRNGIDTFVLARLEKEGLTPSPVADRLTLLRRLHLDLTGLPPSPEEVTAYLDDARPGAYERAVDRLLASPHYGERWGRHWLDLARYADSDGYEKDTGRPHAWRYRHWVIDALNRDVPYDRFTVEQLAGDLLPGATVEQKVATGFHRNTLTNKEGGVDKEQYRVEAVVDRVNTTARVWLGLTMGCAQCHDHKYDPLSQREYFQMFAFFDRDVEVDLPAPLLGYEMVTALPKKKSKKASDAPSGVMAQTLALGKPRKTHVMIRGDFLRPGVEVRPAAPEVIESGKPMADRRDLAEWLVDGRNPLTARVAVNWAWHKFFGRGIVPTLDDFGTQGEKPSHPELLDWLASEFVRRGWGMKELHRLIVTSATYRQSSHVRPELLARDPYNTLLARQSRQRLEAEILRDAMLASGGLLTRTVGGPSVRPPQPAGISELTYAGSARWEVSRGADRHRRGLYTWFQRTSPYPMLMTFDAPDATLCCARRERSNTPLQALTLLNDVVFVECARGLAERVLRDVKGDVESRLSHAVLLTTSRLPTPEELARLRSLFEELHDLSRKDVAAAKALAGDAGTGVPRAEAAAWVALARTLLNLDEAVTRE
jgi:hypothetical protein